MTKGKWHPQLVLWLVTFGLLGVLAKFVYRPIVYSFGIDDLGLQGVLPNFFWAGFSALFFARYFGSAAAACVSAFAGNALYELDQLRHDGFEDRLLSSSSRTFDPWDIVAAGVACVLVYGLLRSIEGARNLPE